MDMGDLTSKQIGELMSGGILRAEEQLVQGGYPNRIIDLGQTASQNELANIARAAFAGLNEADRGTIPSTIKNQNLGHNSKKVGMGPNTKR